MTRRIAGVIAVAVAIAAAVALWVTFGAADDRAPVRDDADASGALTLLIVRTAAGPYGAVLGSTGGPDGALVLPPQTRVVVPGQGQARIDEALALPAEQAATTVANLLGTGVAHTISIGREKLVAVVDRAGGIEVGDETMTGADALASLEGSGRGGTTAFALVLEALLRSGVTWEPADVASSDSPSTALETLASVRDAPVRTLEVAEAQTGVFLAEPDAVREALVEAFGGPDRDVVEIIVLNGSGVPGIGELVAERLVPDGFRVVVSENASSFDHEETLVVVGSADDVGLGERVRDLLGTGSVNVSVSSGIAPVTIVVGKDFAG